MVVAGSASDSEASVVRAVPRAEVAAGNLPVHLSSFVGREAEIDEVRRMLYARRLVTLSGPGGCGKTRLALEVANSVVGRFPDGVWWVDLAPLADASLVPATLARVLGVAESPVEPVTNTMVAFLASRRTLVVLDNCEHLIEACAAVVARVEVGCSASSMLVTSREPLGVPGEATWRVPPLGLPSGGSLESVGGSDAVRLFVDRARDARPSFALTDANAEAVAEICSRLDGIPLAIELAAARTRLLSVEEIAAGLADRFHLLTGGARWALPRHRTLEGSLDWSHEPLNVGERALFRRLGAFAGSFTLDAATSVCTGDHVSPAEVLDLLSGLVDRSLVHVIDDAGSQTRYRLLETIRAYAVRKLVEANERDTVGRRHLEFYVAFADRAARGLAGPDLLAWLARVDVESDNLRAALDTTSAPASGKQARIVGLLTLYWFARSDLSIGRSRLEAALDSAAHDGIDRASALCALCVVCYRAGDMAKAARYGDDAIRIARHLGDVRMLGQALHWRGWVRCWGEADRHGAWSAFREAEALLRQTDDHVFQALNLALLAWSYADTSEAARARPLIDEGLALTDAVDVPHARCYCLIVGAYLDTLEGSLERAAARLDEAIALSTGIGDHYAGLFARGFLAYTDLVRGRRHDGRELCERGLSTALDHRSPMGEALMRMALGHLAFAQGDLDTAADQLEAAFEMLALLWQGAAAMCRAVQSQVAIAQSRADEARRYAAEALTLGKETDTVGAVVWAMIAQASLARLDGAAQRAEDLLQGAVELSRQTGRRSGMCDLLDDLAAAVADQGRCEEAARLLGAAQSLRDTTGAARFPVRDASHEVCTTLLRDAMGVAAFDAAWAAGAALTLDDAVAYARRGRGRRKRPTQGWESLTPTELEVVELVAAGLTNPQIGERLFVSKRTVQAHLAHIFTKLDVSTRAELAAQTAARRLADA